MITAITSFKLPPGTTLEAATKIFEASVPRYSGFPGLARKYFCYGSGDAVCGIYLWESRAAADKLYTADWRKGIRERFGSDPTVTFYETPVIIENTGAATKAA